jgi:hypothetical protein
MPAGRPSPWENASTDAVMQLALLSLASLN